MQVKDLTKDFPVESWDIESIIPYPDNAKIHTEEQVNTIASAIEEFGFDQPIVVDGEGVIIKGHGRRLAALKLGMQKVPVVMRADMTPEQVRAARLADNRVAVGEVDTDLLQREMMALSIDSKDLLEKAGFSEKEISLFTEQATQIDDSAFVQDLEESVAEVEAETQSKSMQVSGEEIAIAQALGFKTVPKSSEALINLLMAKVRADYEKPPSEAFVAFAKDVVENS